LILRPCVIFRVAEPGTNEILWRSVFAEPRRTETPEGMKARLRLSASYVLLPSCGTPPSRLPLPSSCDGTARCGCCLPGDDKLSHPDGRGEILDCRGHPERENVDSAIGLAVVPQRAISSASASGTFITECRKPIRCDVSVRSRCSRSRITGSQP